MALQPIERPCQLHVLRVRPCSYLVVHVGGRCRILKVLAPLRRRLVHLGRPLEIKLMASEK